MIALLSMRQLRMLQQISHIAIRNDLTHGRMFAFCTGSMRSIHEQVDRLTNRTTWRLICRTGGRVFQKSPWSRLSREYCTWETNQAGDKLP